MAQFCATRGSVGLTGVRDLLQRRHSILRNYPVLGHVRFLMETIRPEIQQHFIESNTDGAPFERETRDLVYARAKGDEDAQPFGRRCGSATSRRRPSRAHQIVASMGLQSFDQLHPGLLNRRIDHHVSASYAELYEWLEPGQLLTAPPASWVDDWELADAADFGARVANRPKGF